MGFNCFRTKAEYEGTEAERQEPLLSGPEGRYLTDLGINVDIKHRRKGYSAEVLCLALEFAFNELLCQVVRMETSLFNEPWRALMRSMGFGHLEKESVATYNDDNTRHRLDARFRTLATNCAYCATLRWNRLVVDISPA
ncbi:hypothetical protein GGR57DRAFT_340148 [Xylariaceae sp. FL1272]|nr:hypothetical protein GGR57DRAFT_340148 [Xylariaceae sp. FL1272]